jgi:uncharacterized membrane protein
MPILVILSRWIHVICACLMIGGIFFARFVMPSGLGILDDETRTKVHLKIRRTFKMVIHSAILLLLITGIYNSTLAWDKYTLDSALLHPLWGTHILLALIAFTFLLIVLAGPVPPRSHRKLMAVNFVVLLAAVAVASTLKWARERVVAEHAAHVSSSEGP